MTDANGRIVIGDADLRELAKELALTCRKICLAMGDDRPILPDDDADEGDLDGDWKTTDDADGDKMP